MNIEQLRDEFPITKTRIYLDNASLSPLPRRVVAAAQHELQDRSERGVNGFWDWLATVDRTRTSIARLIGAHEDEVTFTQNTSEGINIVAAMLDWRLRDNVIINDLEYYPNTYPWLSLRRRGVEVRIVRHRDGRIEPGDIAAVVDRRIAWWRSATSPGSTGFGTTSRRCRTSAGRSAPISASMRSSRWVRGLSMSALASISFRPAAING